MKIKLLLLLGSRGIPAAGMIALTLIVPFYYDLDSAASFFIGITTLYVLSIIGRLGLDYSILKHSSISLHKEKKTIGREEFFSFTICFFLLFIFSVGMYFLEPVSIHLKSFDWVLMTLPFFGVQGLFSSFFKSTGHDYLGGIFEPSICALMSILFFFSFESIQSFEDSYKYSAWCVFAVSSLLVFCIYDVDFRGGGFNLSFFIEARHHVVNQMASYLTQWYPIYVLGFVSNKVLVYYAVSNRIASAISFVAVTLDSYASPRFSNLWREKGIYGVRELRTKIKKISVILASALSFLVFIICGVYGWAQEYGVSYFVIAFFMTAIFSSCLATGPNGFLLMMVGKERLVKNISISIFLGSSVFTTVGYFIGNAYFIVFMTGFFVLLRSVIFLNITNLFLSYKAGEKEC